MIESDVGNFGIEKLCELSELVRFAFLDGEHSVLNFFGHFLALRVEILSEMQEQAETVANILSELGDLEFFLGLRLFLFFLSFGKLGRERI